MNKNSNDRKNQINQTNRMNQINRKKSNDRINQINSIDKDELVRLFISIEPDDLLLKTFDEITYVLKENTRGSYTRSENIHLTLVFIGEIKEEKIDSIKQTMDEVSFDSFEILLSAIGRFKRYGGDIVWVGFKNEKKLELLVENLKAKLLSQGFEIDKKKFTPHITLGRRIKYNTHFDDFLQKVNDKELIKSQKMNVLKYSLMKSEVIDGKRVYTEVYSKHANEK